MAEGSAKPTRSIAGQKTLFTRTIHGMAYNPVRDEIVVPQFFTFAILTFRGDATGNVPPIRTIMGPDTQLMLPDRVEVDGVHGEIFVPQDDKILVFPVEGDGNVKPIRVLEGPDTQLGGGSVVPDPVHNLLIVRGSAPGQGQRGAQILIFNRTDQGNAKPRAIIKGPKTLLATGDGLATVYPPRGWIVVAARGVQQSSPDSFIGIWSIHDNGDVAPRWTIGGPNGILRRTRGITLDPESKTVIASDKYLNAVFTWHLPEMF
jgi:hypothetical protein